MILARLRAGTREKHQRLEQVVDLPTRLSSETAYRGLLEAFYGLYRPLETRLAEHPELGASGLASERLHKHKLLEQDLLSLGDSADVIASLRTCPKLPNLQNLFSAAGCLYVLEGATLGGQIVRREVDSRLNLTRDSGCLFFDCYGHRVREMWSGFCTDLDALAVDNPDNSDDIVEGACETFSCFEEWMR
jgi:heme oxygenase